MNIDPITLIGTTGALLVLFAFVQNNRGKWETTNIFYDCMNLLGSALLLTYAILLGSLPFMLTNTVWGLLSLRDVAKYFWGKYS